MTGIEARIRAANWRQGDLVQHDWTDRILDRCIDLRPSLSDGKQRLVVVSQDCDIVASEDREPYVELLMASTKATECPDYLKGKNPRWLHLHYCAEFLEFSINDRFRVAKGDFAEAGRDIDNPLDDSSKDHLRRWLGRRYLRSAFPDAFNERLNSAKAFARFEKSELAKKVSVILLETLQEELPEGTPYPLKVIAGISDEISAEDRDDIERTVMSGISVTGINLIDLRLATEDEITYRDLRSYRRLDRDYRSLPDHEKVASPPAGIDAM